MKNFATGTLFLIAMLVLAAVPAHANPAFPTPEIDPSFGTGALALLGGGLVVLRSRRKR